MVNAYDLGADDYMTKPFSLMVLVSKVHAFMRRLGSDGALIRSGEISVNYSEMKAYKNKEPVSLSKKELQLLLFLLENAGQIVSKEQILEESMGIWTGSLWMKIQVPVNISRLKSKIGNDYIRNVRGLGYIWTEEVSKSSSDSRAAFSCSAGRRNPIHCGGKCRPKGRREETWGPCISGSRPRSGVCGDLSRRGVRRRGVRRTGNIGTVWLPCSGYTVFSDNRRICGSHGRCFSPWLLRGGADRSGKCKAAPAGDRRKTAPGRRAERAENEL